MNGCGGKPEDPVEMCETRTLPAVTTPEMAVTQLNSAILGLKDDPPRFGSGIIRLQVINYDRILNFRARFFLFFEIGKTSFFYYFIH